MMISFSDEEISLGLSLPPPSNNTANRVIFFRGRGNMSSDSSPASVTGSTNKLQLLNCYEPLDKLHQLFEFQDMNNKLSA